MLRLHPLSAYRIIDPPPSAERLVWTAEQHRTLLRLRRWYARTHGLLSCREVRHCDFVVWLVATGRLRM